MMETDKSKFKATKKKTPTKPNISWIQLRKRLFFLELNQDKNPSLLGLIKKFNFSLVRLREKYIFLKHSYILYYNFSIPIRYIKIIQKQNLV